MRINVGAQAFQPAWPGRNKNKNVKEGIASLQSGKKPRVFNKTTPLQLKKEVAADIINKASRMI